MGWTGDTFVWCLLIATGVLSVGLYQAAEGELSRATVLMIVAAIDLIMTARFFRHYRAFRELQSAS